MKPSVLIFDSGAGGLSIASEIRALLPSLPIHYLMDDAGFPYGLCPDEVLSSRIVTLCLKAQHNLNATVLVIACNTASTLILDQLRNVLPIPVVGVVPAIKTAAHLSKTDNIGLLATPATVSRTYTDRLISDFASHCQVRRKGSPELVTWAEDYIRNGIITPSALFEHLNAWLTQPSHVSHVVLGCTHFPLLTQHLASLWPDIGWVDSGNAIARRVQFLLEKNSGHPVPTPAIPTVSLWWTSNRADHAGVQRYLLQLGSIEACGQL